MVLEISVLEIVFETKFETLRDNLFFFLLIYLLKWVINITEKGSWQGIEEDSRSRLNGWKCI